MQYKTYLSECQLLADVYSLLPVCRTLQGGCIHHGPECSRPGKAPVIRDWAARLPLSESSLLSIVSQMWPCNLAIVTSSTMAIVEADSPQAGLEIIELCGGVEPVTPTREARSGRGRAYIFALPDGGSIGPKAHVGQSGAIDIITGGGYLVAPPSVHASGHRYTWVSGREPWTIAHAPIPDGLLKLAASTSHQQQALKPAPWLSKQAHYASTRPKVRALLDGTGKTSGDLSQSGYDYSAARELAWLGVRPPEILRILVDRGTHRDEAYLSRVVSGACADVAEVRNHG